jgi:GNAT superfamily N-acetyltransferase
VTTPELRSFDAHAAQAELDSLVAVYLEVYPTNGDGFHSESRYRRQITGHMTTPGWKLVTATLGGETAGYAYGFPLPASTRWWSGLLTSVPSGFADEDGHRTFAISEVLVRSLWRRQGIARALHDELLADRTEDRATLLVEPDNNPAQMAYARWGWQKVAQLRPSWENAPIFDVLVRPLNPAPMSSTASGQPQ